MNNEYWNDLNNAYQERNDRHLEQARENAERSTQNAIDAMELLE